MILHYLVLFFFFFQAEDGIRDKLVTGVQTCALPISLTRPSVAQIRAARVALPGLSHVGYVRGAADRVPEALLAIGVPVELIGADSLARGDLSRYDAIVIGSRAYETEPGLVANNGRLLDYVTKGGLLIVQYQQYPFVDGGFAP